MFKIYDGREQFYQWDINRKLIVEDASIVEVHFCNRTDDCSLVCETYVEDGVTLVNVPNILLQNDWRIHVYAFDGEHTKHDACYDIIARTKPADYAYEETEVLTWHTINEKVDEALGNTGYYVPSIDTDGNLTWEGSTEFLPEVAIVNIKGEKGDKGATGATGARGEKGEKGDKGDKGDRGEQGLQGVPGKDGTVKFEELTEAQKAELKGEKGEQGERGFTGATGAAGKDGISVTHEWNGTTLTITSASGTTSQDLKGAKGDKGDKGDRGEKGEPGAIGAQGIQGERGLTGAQGIQGEKGLKGDKGDTGKDGYTPVKGIDYWTAAEQQEIITATADAINAGFVTDGELETTLKSYLSKPEAMGTYVNNSRFDIYVSAQNDTYNKVKALEENTYTKSEVDAKIAAGGGGGGSADLTGYATEKYVDDAIAAIPQPDLTGYVTETELNGKGYTTMSAVEGKGYATTVYVDNAVANAGGGSSSGAETFTFNVGHYDGATDEEKAFVVDYYNYFNTNEKLKPVTIYLKKKWTGEVYAVGKVEVQYANRIIKFYSASTDADKNILAAEFQLNSSLTKTNNTNMGILEPFISGGGGGGGSWTHTYDSYDGNLYNATEIYVMLEPVSGAHKAFSYVVTPPYTVLGDYTYQEFHFTTPEGMEIGTPRWFYDGSSICLSSADNCNIMYIAYK